MSTSGKTAKYQNKNKQTKKNKEEYNLNLIKGPANSEGKLIRPNQMFGRLSKTQSRMTEFLHYNCLQVCRPVPLHTPSDTCRLMRQLLFTNFNKKVSFPIPTIR